MSEKKTDVVKDVAKPDEHAVEFIPFGASDKLRLTASMVRQFIAIPTKSGALPSERDCIRFIMLCRGKRANPFEGDCFLIGYDSQSGPSFSLVCGLELFLKRASTEPSYDGAQSGVIVMGPGGSLVERAGTITMEKEKLVGGWAKVFRKDRKEYEYKTVKFETYNTDRSRWLKDPAGMIAKVALSQALRSAYPTALGGLYTQEEMERITETGESVMQIKEPIEQPRRLSEGPMPAIPEPAATTPDGTEPFTDESEASGKTTPTEDDSQIIQGIVKEVTSKTGKTKGRDWTLYSIRADLNCGMETMTTFDKSLADFATERKGQMASFVVERTTKGINLLDMGEATEA